MEKPSALTCFDFPRDLALSHFSLLRSDRRSFAILFLGPQDYNSKIIGSNTQINKIEILYCSKKSMNITPWHIFINTIELIVGELS